MSKLKTETAVEEVSSKTVITFQNFFSLTIDKFPPQESRFDW